MKVFAGTKSESSISRPASPVRIASVIRRPDLALITESARPIVRKTEPSTTEFGRGVSGARAYASRAAPNARKANVTANSRTLLSLIPPTSGE